MKSALIILANGFEEVEAIAVIDVLRRGKVHVKLAGLHGLWVPSARHVIIQADAQLADVQDQLFDAVILPGGEPGTTGLEESPLVAEILNRHVHAQKWIAAICAAPRILNGLGLLDGRRATSFPGTKSAMNRCTYIEQPVVKDGHFITSRGPGTALKFGLEIVAALTSEEDAAAIASAMLVA